jgi:hypothetical protein
MNLGQAKKILNKNTVEGIIAPMSRKTGTANIATKTTPTAVGGFKNLKDFEKVYPAQHKDIASKTIDEQLSKKYSILENGFEKEGFNVNAAPIHIGRGGSPTDVMEKAYGNKKGDIVYLIKKDGLINGPNGYKTKAGYKPNEEEVVMIEYDGQPTFEAYINQQGKKLPNPTRPPEVGGRSTLKSLIPIAAGSTLLPKDALAAKHKQMAEEQALQDAYSPVDMVIAGATGGATMGLRAISALADPVINYAIDRMLGD